MRLLLGLSLASLVAACAADEDPFYARCTSSDECPDRWICPDPTTPGIGTIGHVCTPECVDDAECQEASGRVDTFCLNSVCHIECNDASDCPDTQPICRGDNPSCDPYLDTLFCATEDFSCD